MESKDIINYINTRLNELNNSGNQGEFYWQDKAVIAELENLIDVINGDY